MPVPLCGSSAFLRCLLHLCLALFSILPAQAAPLRLVILGDSLSAEYDSISGFAGIGDPTEYAAITVPGWESMSWVEVLGRTRTNDVNLGVYDGAFPGWTDPTKPYDFDFRFTGYEYNFAIPGFEASQFEQIVNSSILSDPQYLPYKQHIADTLQNHADAAVVWLGGNEFRANYGYLYDGGDPVPFVNTLSSDLAEVLDFVLARKPGIKLVVVNLPDLGATPDKQAAHPDPLKRANVTAATVLANQAIANLVSTRGIAVADVFSKTSELVNGETLWIGPVSLFPGSDPDNEPRHAFTRDGLHPNTCLQAQIANIILEAFNQYYGTTFSSLTDAEMLNLIRVNPMQVYLDWVHDNSLSLSDPGDDPDHDRWVNLAEFLFDSNPTVPTSSPLRVDESTLPPVVRYHPDPDRLHVVDIQPQWSTNLTSWEDIPPQPQSTASDGTVIIALPEGENARFVRLLLSVRRPAGS